LIQLKFSNTYLRVSYIFAPTICSVFFLSFKYHAHHFIRKLCTKPFYCSIPYIRVCMYVCVRAYMYVCMYVFVCLCARRVDFQSEGTLYGRVFRDLEDGQYKRRSRAKRVFSTMTLTTLLATASSLSKTLRQYCSVVFFEVPTFLGGFGLQTPPIKRTQRDHPLRYGGRSLKLPTSLYPPFVMCLHDLALK
jgi:hypothetical protein